MAQDAHGAGSRETGVGSFGLQVLLVALAVLFAATVIVTWWFRDQAAQWDDAVRPLPLGLWLTSLALVGVSAAVETAARAAARPASFGSRAVTFLGLAGLCMLIFQIGRAHV